MPVYSFTPETELGRKRRSGENVFVYAFIPKEEILYHFYGQTNLDFNTLLQNPARFNDQKEWCLANYELKRTNSGWSYSGQKRLEFTNKFYFLTRYSAIGLPFSATRGYLTYWGFEPALTAQEIPTGTVIGFLPVDFIGEKDFEEFVKNVIHAGGVYVWLQIQGVIDVGLFYGTYATTDPSERSLNSITEETIPLQGSLFLSCRKNVDSAANIPEVFAVRNRFAPTVYLFEFDQAHAPYRLLINNSIILNTRNVYRFVGTHVNNNETYYNFFVETKATVDIFSPAFTSHNVTCVTSPINPTDVSLDPHKLARDCLLTF